MIPFRAFEIVVNLITGSRERESKEHQEFLTFYQDLVAIVPEEIAKEFKSVKVPTRIGRTVEDSYQLELTISDLMWWQSIINGEKGRFVEGVSQVQRQIWDRLAILAKNCSLTDDQKTKLLSLSSYEQVDMTPALS